METDPAQWQGRLDNRRLLRHGAGHDVRDERSVESFIRDVMSMTKRIDVRIYNAGHGPVARPCVLEIGETNHEHFHKRLRFLAGRDPSSFHRASGSARWRRPLCSGF